jgi:hypothetical protein
LATLRNETTAVMSAPFLVESGLGPFDKRRQEA